jgi:hypothetical protein
MSLETWLNVEEHGPGDEKDGHSKDQHGKGGDW